MIKKLTVNTPYPVGAVHFYLKQYDDFLILFDSGPCTDESKEYLKQNVDLSKLKYTFITHCHVDHHGLADFIKRNSDSEIVIPREDYLKFTEFDKVLKGFEEIAKNYGFNEEELKFMLHALLLDNKKVPLPKEVLVLEDMPKEELDSLGISFIACPGHSQSDIVYLIDDYAITGDVLLREIFQTPLLDVSNTDYKSRFLNYEEFCKTLLKLKQIENKIFLPGHRDYIDSIDERIIFYLTKLIERTIYIKDYLLNEGIVFVLKKLVSDKLIDNPVKTYLKLSELVFIKDFLDEPEKIINILKKIDVYKELKEKFDKLFEGKLNAV